MIDTEAVAALPTLPEIETLRVYKSVYALCTVVQGQMKATHYAAVLIGGNAPLWGVWQVSGKFMRFAGSRGQIEKSYPSLVWRRKMATWHCADVTDKSIETRRAELATMYGKRVPT